jgi:membrane-bound serine protease (ClpP class)
MRSHRAISNAHHIFRAPGAPRARRSGAIALAPRLAWHRFLALASLILLALVSLPASGADAPAASSGVPALAPIPAARAAQRLAVITIQGEIHAITARSFERRLKAAVDGGADGIIVELNTPGGEVGAVLDICTMIKQSPIANTIAWVHPTAYSGGAIIALACREIVLSSVATMGDAAPVSGNPIQFAQGLKDTERQKILAPLLAEVVDSARRRGYDEKLVQGFLTLGVELWLVRDKQTGQRYFVDENEYRAIFGTEPTRGRPYVASGSASAAWSADDATSAPSNDDVAQGLVEEPSRDADRPSSSATGDSGDDSQGDAAGPTAFRPASPALEDVPVSDIKIDTASTRPTFSSADRGRFELVEYAVDGNTLLTLKEGDLRRYGFADPLLTINNDQDLLALTGAQHIIRLDQSWSEDLVAFMTMGMTGLIVRGVLIIVFLLAMFIELSMPGVGLPGAIALLALVGLIVPPMLMGASTWWALAMILLGILLVLLELFVLPGFGLPGVLGLVMLFGGLVGTFAGVGQLFPGTGPDSGASLSWAASVVLLAGFVAGVGIYFFVRYTDKFPLAGKLVLADRAVVGDDDTSGGMLAAMSTATDTSRGPVALGAKGRAVSPLRPSGSAEFGDTLVDVVSEFGFIETGAPVRVTSVTEYRVAVERIRDDAAPNSTGPGNLGSSNLGPGAGPGAGLTPDLPSDSAPRGEAKA